MSFELHGISALIFMLIIFVLPIVAIISIIKKHKLKHFLLVLACVVGGLIAICFLILLVMLIYSLGILFRDMLSWN